jgi:hypothetical protein
MRACVLGAGVHVGQARGFVFVEVAPCPSPRDPGRKARLERRQERRQAPRGSGPRQFDCGFEAQSIHILFANALFIASKPHLSEGDGHH